MNINYCGYIQVMADYKKKYINPLPGITLLRSIYQ